MMPFQTKLSGVEIANVRTQAARCNTGTEKRRNRFKPHVGKKQLAKISARQK